MQEICTFFCYPCTFQDWWDKVNWNHTVTFEYKIIMYSVCIEFSPLDKLDFTLLDFLVKDYFKERLYNFDSAF